MNVIEIGKAVRELFLADMRKAMTKHNGGFRKARKNSFPFPESEPGRPIRRQSLY
jgi:hypothetical protein